MKRKPYNLFLLIGFIFVVISLFVLSQHNSIDIHLHDTYFVITHTHFFWFLAILALFVWVLYLLTNKFLFSKALTWIHVIITILTLVFFALALYYGDNLSNLQPRRYYEYSSLDSFNDYDRYTKTIGTVLSILIFGQIIFVINVIVGLFKRKR
jgi:heme/copper-type cytochrome/quinol oxidase subunit 1